jgi:hypothetical protein
MAVVTRMAIAATIIIVVTGAAMRMTEGFGTTADTTADTITTSVAMTMDVSTAEVTAGGNLGN